MRLAYRVTRLGFWWLASSALGLTLVRSPLAAQGVSVVTGRVSDRETTEPVAAASVSIEGTLRTVVSDPQGRYRLDSVPAGPQVLRVVAIGYAPVRRAISAAPSGTVILNIEMARSALNLLGIVVTADPISRARGELGTSSVIEREAIRSQTAASLAGLLELVPGVTLAPPGLDGVQQFGLRSVPITSGNLGGPNVSQPSAGSLASFGTQIVLDGIPVSNNANLQSLGPRGELSFATSAGGGVDLRRIPASTIERVEVIRGIPSARFGDLTQGTVLVETRAGAIAPEVLARLDARTLEGNAIGGLTLGGRHTGSSTFDVARTRVEPGRTDAQAYRFSLQLAHRYESRRLRLDTRFDGFQLVDDRPETPSSPGYETRSRDNGLRVSERARLSLGPLARIEWTGALEAIRQRSFSRSPLLRGAEPFTDRLTEGRQTGKFVGGAYNARVDVDGDPRQIYHRLELIAEPRWLRVPQTVRAGMELRREWNSGPGYLFDIEFPPQVTFNGVNGYDRPRRFDSIPPLVTTALYLDDRITRRLGAEGHLGLQAGLRLDLLHRGGWWASAVRDQVLQPRINVEVGPAAWIRFRAGAGRLAKVPTLASLFPGLQYYDLINVNYYANDPAERLAVLTTRIVDKTNPDLGYSVADKREAGVEVNVGDALLAAAAFRDRVTGGVGIAFEPVAFLREHFRIVDSTIGTGRPPDYEVPAFSADSVPVLIDRPSNNLTFISSGAELIASIPEIPGTHTRIAVQGAYVRSRVENGGIEFGSGFDDFQLTDRIPRAPFWDGATRTGERLLLTTRLIHQQPQAGLVLTGTVQFTLRERRQDIGGTDTLSFAGYLTRAGELVRVPPAQRADPQYRDLQVPRSGLLSVPQSGPVDWLFSIQAAKTLPGGGRLSFYAFNALDKLGNYGDRDTASRLFPAMRFGLELTMPVMVWRH